MEDRLSILPESVLCHILSFLPTKQAVATSVLSKKWKPLWRSVPTLDFNDSKYFTTSKEVYARFVHSVYAVMLSRDLDQPIHTFRLKCICSPCLDMANVKVWLNVVAQRGIQHLDIFLSFEKLSSSAIFTCKTLVVLKLEHLDLKPLNSSVDLPFLKTLHIQHIGWEFSPEGQGRDPQFSPMLHKLTRLELFYRHYNDNWLHL